MRNNDQLVFYKPKKKVRTEKMMDYSVPQTQHTVVVHFVLIFCSSLISLSLHYIVGGVWGFAPSTRDNFTTMHFVGPRPHDTKIINDDKYMNLCHLHLFH